MPSRRCVLRVCSFCVLVLLFCLRAASAAAQTTDADIDRIVTLRVQYEELRVHWNLKKLTTADYNEQRKPIDAELRALQAPIKKLPAAERQRIEDRIEGLVSAKLSVLAPQWRAEG